MSSTITMTIADPLLKNAVNRLFVTVNLEKYWETIKTFQYITVSVDMNIPVIEYSVGHNLLLRMQQEYLVETISEEEKTVIMEADIVEKIDQSREGTGTANLSFYEKTLI